MLAVVVAVLAAGLIALPASAARQSIQKTEITNLADAVQITVTASLPLSIHPGRIGDRFIVFDLYGHLSATAQKRMTINAGGIKTVTCGWYRSSPAVARIAVGTTGMRQYSVTYENGKRRVLIRIGKSGCAVGPATSGCPSKPSAASAQAKEALLPPISTISLPELSVEPVLAGLTPALRELETEAISLEPEVRTISRPVLVASAEPIAVPTPRPRPVRTRLAGSRSELPANVASKADGGISLDFVASDIHDVLKGLAMQGGVNIVASPDVKGEVTVSLSDVSVEDALKLVTNLSGFKFAKVDGSYVVGTSENLRNLAAGGLSAGQDEKVSAVVAINYSDPAVVSKILEKEFGTVQVSTGSGDAKESMKGPAFLVLSGRPADVEAAKTMVTSIEASVASASAETVIELCEVKYANVGELPALLMASVPGLQVAVGPTQGFDLECPSAVIISTDSGGQQSQSPAAKKAAAKTLLLQGTQVDVDKGKALLARIDVPQAQIIIEAKVVDLTEDGAKDLGIKWGGEFGSLTQFSVTENRSIGEQVGTIGRFGRTPLQFLGDLRAIVESGNGKILANPNVMALDGKPASIFIGDEVKYVTRVDQTDDGIEITTETARVGVQLHCVSSISSDGYITMNLHPEVSVITDWKELPDTELMLPEIARRFVDSTVRVKDGETIVIGGLIKDEEIRSMSGIPLLKDIPIIGGLFRYDHKTRNHSEVMMFITPRIVSAT